MPKTTPTIAKVVTAYVMTDATIRIVEYADTPNFATDPAIYCETPEDAIEYISACDLLAVNPAWYREVNSNA